MENNMLTQVENEFATVKSLVEYTLNKHNFTRSSDTKLFFQCCRELGATTLEGAERLGLNVISVHKLRQVIQNKEGRFLPSEETQENRATREIVVKDYMRVQ